MANKVAVLEEAKAHCTVKTLPNLEPNPSNLRIENRAIPTYSTDRIMRDRGMFIEDYEIVLGSDVVGIVETVDSSVYSFKKGDRLAGYADILSPKSLINGAFQQYIIVRDCAATRTRKPPSFLC
ncbi:MAG: hypothetical protein Q9164_002141 [Protoblastenia rupestris]